MTVTDIRPTTGNYTDRASVDSSNLREVLFDSPTNTLFVVFLGGRVAGYRGVPKSEYVNLTQAASPGRYYNTFIKNHYDGKQAPENFVLRAATPVVEDVTDNVEALAPWVTNPVDEDVTPLDSSTYEVTLYVEGNGILDVMNTLHSLGVGNAVVSVVEVESE